MCFQMEFVSITLTNKVIENKNFYYTLQLCWSEYVLI